MPFGKVIVAIANKHARQIWAMLARDVDYDPYACLNHPMFQPPGKLQRRTRPTRPSQTFPFQRQREVVDNGSGRPGENLTNQMDVQTKHRPIPELRVQSDE